MPATLKRHTYPDGRLMPQPGDAVYQMTAGPFGTGACIFGEVYAARSGNLRVRVTGSASMLATGAN